LNELQDAMNDQAERLAALESIEGECQIIREENGDFASKVGELEQQNENLQARIKELISELDEARRSQSESENEQIKSLSSKLTALEA
jgi:polyhydroxyalkanoate synthesis regulator phasin